MRTLLIAAAAAVGLSACQTTQIDSSIQKNLPKACAALSTAYATFLALEPTLKESAAEKIKVAYAGVYPICSDPSNATGTDVLIRVAAAYATITVALKNK